MQTMANIIDEESNERSQWMQEKQDDHPVAWSKEQAEAWRKTNQPVSQWRLVVTQVAVVGLLAVLVGIIFNSHSLAMSVAYGGICVIVPSALFIHGVRVQHGANIRQRMVKFMVWELAKIALTISMLYVAPKVINELNWLALLAGFVVTIKLYWVAFLKLPVRSR